MLTVEHLSVRYGTFAAVDFPEGFSGSRAFMYFFLAGQSTKAYSNTSRRVSIV